MCWVCVAMCSNHAEYTRHHDTEYTRHRTAHNKHTRHMHCTQPPPNTVHSALTDWPTGLQYNARSSWRPLHLEPQCTGWPDPRLQ